MKYILLISGLLIALVAAVFSVTGLSVLYGGSYMVISLFVALEIAKVSIAFAYHTIPSYKIPLTTAMVVLAIITSLGIFAGLNSSFQETAVKLDVAKNRQLTVENRLERTKQQQADNIEVLGQVNAQLSQARQALVNPAQSSWMQNGERMSVVDKRQRAIVQDQISDIESQKLVLDSMDRFYQNQIVALEDSIASLKMSQTEFIEAGPMIFISEAFDISLGETSFYFSLLIVLVFDPLAILLISLFNNWTTVQKVPSAPPHLAPAGPTPVVSHMPPPEPPVEEEDLYEAPPEDLLSMPLAPDPITPEPPKTNIYGDYIDLKLSDLMDRITEVPIGQRDQYFQFIKEGNIEGAEGLLP